MSLDGTVKTPFGPISKKTAMYGGAVVIGLGVIVWVRHTKSASTPTTDTSNAEIDPATGYPYGSPEDAAALAAQGNYTLPVNSGGGGSSGIPNSNVGYTSNGQWVQGVIGYFTSNALVTDPSGLSTALGKYITGAYVAPGSNDDLLIQQAIAVQGYPPIAGSTGYPPSINRTPPVNKPGTPGGLHTVSISTNRINVAWTEVPGNRGYDITWTDQKGAVGNATSLTAAYSLTNLPKNFRYVIKVRTRPETGGTQSSEWSNPITVTTKAK